MGLHRKLNPCNDKKVKNFISTYPALSRFHFPTGGHRFRPCLEDVLEALRQEFKLKVSDKEEWEARLAEARLKWRKIQTAAAVRDCPEAALRVLVDELGMPSPVGCECPPDNESKVVRGYRIVLLLATQGHVFQGCFRVLEHTGARQVHRIEADLVPAVAHSASGINH